LETLEVFLSIVLAVAAGVLIARKFKDRLLAVIGLAVAFSIIEAFFAPAVALTSIGLAVLAFFVYVTSKTDWIIALTPLSREEILKHRDESRRSPTAVEVE
jgi:predicted membrane-bound spermidine synthase